MPLTSVISASSGSDPWSAKSSTWTTWLPSHGTSRTTSAPPTKIAARARPIAIGATTGRRSSERLVIRPRWIGPDANAPIVQTAARPTVAG